jgi:hypothetical protein
MEKFFRKGEKSLKRENPRHVFAIQAMSEGNVNALHGNNSNAAVGSATRNLMIIYGLTLGPKSTRTRAAKGKGKSLSFAFWDAESPREQSRKFSGRWKYL